MSRFNRAFKAFMKNDSINVPLKEYIEVHTKKIAQTLKRQLQTFNNLTTFQFKVRQGIIMISYGIALWSTFDGRKSIDMCCKQDEDDRKKIDMHCKYGEADFFEITPSLNTRK